MYLRMGWNIEHLTVTDWRLIKRWKWTIQWLWAFIWSVSLKSSWSSLYWFERSGGKSSILTISKSASTWAPSSTLKWNFQNYDSVPLKFITGTDLGACYPERRDCYLKPPPHTHTPSSELMTKNPKLVEVLHLRKDKKIKSRNTERQRPPQPIYHSIRLANMLEIWDMTRFNLL